MSMMDWAKREVEIACKREAPDRKDGEWDYGCACYESALKAYESLCNDEHSGMSWGFTKQILTRLMDGKPLTPIEDVPEVWSDKLSASEDKEKQFQCKRMYSLFKYIHDDGTVTYSDTERVSLHELITDTFWHSGMASKLVNEMFPITMPYNPASKPYIVEAEEYLTDRKNGDYDTVAYLNIIKPDGEKIPINRYFADAEDGMQEITLYEFQKRYKMHLEREKREDEEEVSNI